MCCPPYITGPDPGIMHVACMTHMHLTTMLNGAAVSWDCRKQEVNALSCCEGEYAAAETAAREEQRLRKLMHDLGEVMVLWCDDQGAIALVTHPTKHGSPKHLDVRYRLQRDRIK